MESVSAISVDGWINSMAASKEGDVYVTSYGETGVELKKVDLAAKKLGEPIEGIESGQGNVGYYASISKSLMQSSSNKLMLVDLETNTLWRAMGLPNIRRT